jgi:hypothetical protein
MIRHCTVKLIETQSAYCHTRTFHYYRGKEAPRRVSLFSRRDELDSELFKTCSVCHTLAKRGLPGILRGQRHGAKDYTSGKMSMSKMKTYVSLNLESWGEDVGAAKTHVNRQL